METIVPNFAPTETKYTGNCWSLIQVLDSFAHAKCLFFSTYLKVKYSLLSLGQILQVVLLSGDVSQLLLGSLRK